MRKLVGRVAAALSIAALCAFSAAALPPPPEDQAVYAPGNKTYVAVDGRSTLSINLDLNRLALSTAVEPMAGGPMDLPPVNEPFSNVDRSCAGATPCLSFLGFAVSAPPSREPAMHAEWSAHDWHFRVEACARIYQGKCFSFLVSFDGRSGARGWYIFSDKRGVEVLASKGKNSTYQEVFVLTSETGLLR